MQKSQVLALDHLPVTRGLMPDDVVSHGHVPALRARTKDPATDHTTLGSVAYPVRYKNFGLWGFKSRGPVIITISFTDDNIPNRSHFYPIHDDPGVMLGL